MVTVEVEFLIGLKQAYKYGSLRFKTLDSVNTAKLENAPREHERRECGPCYIR